MCIKECLRDSSSDVASSCLILPPRPVLYMSYLLDTLFCEPLAFDWVKRFEKNDILRIVRALAIFRPSLIALQMPLSLDDEVFVEKCFQRSLLVCSSFSWLFISFLNGIAL